LGQPVSLHLVRQRAERTPVMQANRAAMR
jgi:hypothetical protein